jgi:hypothetical protein
VAVSAKSGENPEKTGKQKLSSCENKASVGQLTEASYFGLITFSSRCRFRLAPGRAPFQA